jgi:acyl-coenzyme A synthetase/AMP-(fatty) acid ligase
VFFKQLERFGEQVAWRNEQGQMSYDELQVQLDHLIPTLPQVRSLVIISASNQPEFLLNYLACLQAGHVVVLVDKNVTSQNIKKLCEIYQPQLYINTEGQHVPKPWPAFPLAKELAILLSTSGSTGSVKQVALSYANLHSNAQAIAEFLPIKADDLTLTTLNPAYSYGLSVLHSHLLRGASVFLNEHSLLSREFWKILEQQPINSFAGVPYSYQMLLRLGFVSKSLPALRYFTQAGGKLDSMRVCQLAKYANEQQKDFFVMYGQTEATARMAFNAKPGYKPGSIGRAIPGGSFCLRDEQGVLVQGVEQEGQLCYSGANLMLGYVHCWQDLAKFIPIKELFTGDLAERDIDGDYRITGRLKRIIKPFGQRLNLAEVEDWLTDKGLQGYAVGTDEKLQVALVTNEDVTTLKKQLSQFLALHPKAIEIKLCLTVPVTQNGKVDYPALQAWFKVN